ncbi:MAG: O-antigen ligase family protein, partial [Anaerolineae bacterium]|nr:O-antigen ligase family protein [Anaerolineae bacterium]
LNRVPLDQVLEAISTGGAINGWDKREEIWSRALYMIQDFSYTGIGLGTFGVVGPVLYPYFLIGPDAQIPHAHNLFLQVTVDLGIPGLISFLSLYGGSLWLAWTGCQRARSWGRADEKALFLGLFAGLVAMGIHGMIDAVTWGIVKPAIVPWWVMGLVAALTRVLPCSREEGGEQGKTEDFTGVTGG